MGISGFLILIVAVSYLAVCPIVAEPLNFHCDTSTGDRFLLSPDKGCQEISLTDNVGHALSPLMPGLAGPSLDFPGQKKRAARLPEAFRDSNSLDQIGQNHSWGRFLDFVSGRTEETAKMKDPYYRHRYPEVSSNWKRLFYQKTPYYYRKGIEIIHLEEGRIRISLVKQKMNYNELVKGLWTEKAYDMVLESNEGWLSNRTIFGEGRSYFLELSFHFE